METQTLQLKGVGQLLKESFELFQARIKIFLGITAVPIGFTLIGWILQSGLKGLHGELLWRIWFLLSDFLFFIATPALIYVLKGKNTIQQAYKKAFQIFFSYLWVFLLVYFIVAGGFLLLIIPGILFLVWFSLTFYVLIFEEKKGISALLESKTLVSGKFWQTLWRFLVLGLIISVSSFLLPSFAFLEEEDAILIVYLSQFFILPFSLIYGYLIYHNLKEIKKNLPT